MNTQTQKPSTNKIFTIIGHGSEKLVEFRKRKKLPHGITLVVFTVCGKFNYTDKICNFLDVFDNRYKHLLEKPSLYKKELTKLFDTSIHVYVGGDYIPTMTTNLFLQFDSRKTEDTILFKSGVYSINRIPSLNKKIINTSPSNLGSDLCKIWSGKIPSKDMYEEKIHNELYRNNIFEPANKYENFYAKSTRRFQIFDILQEVGNGIYYYVGCRYVQYDLLYSKAFYNDIYNNSSEQQTRIGRFSDENKTLRLINGDVRTLSIEKKIKKLTTEVSNNIDFLRTYNNKLFQIVPNRTQMKSKTTPLYLLPNVFYNNFITIREIEKSCINMIVNIIKCSFDLSKILSEYKYGLNIFPFRKNKTIDINNMIESITVSANNLANLSKSMFHDEYYAKSTYKTRIALDTVLLTNFIQNGMTRLTTVREEPSFSVESRRSVIKNFDILENKQSAEVQFKLFNNLNLTVIEKLKIIGENKKSGNDIIDSMNITLNNIILLARRYVKFYKIYVIALNNFCKEAYANIHNPTTIAINNSIYNYVTDRIIDKTALPKSIIECDKISESIQNINTTLFSIIRKNKRDMKNTGVRGVAFTLARSRRTRRIEPLQEASSSIS